MNLPDTLLTKEEVDDVWHEIFCEQPADHDWFETHRKAQNAKAKREFFKWLESYQTITNAPGLEFYIRMSDYEALRKWALGEVAK